MHNALLSGEGGEGEGEGVGEGKGEGVRERGREKVVKGEQKLEIMYVRTL